MIRQLLAIGAVAGAVVAGVTSEYRPGLASTGRLDLSIGPSQRATRLPVLLGDGTAAEVVGVVTRETGRVAPRDKLLTLSISNHPGDVYFAVHSTTVPSGRAEMVFFADWHVPEKERGKPARYTADLLRGRAGNDVLWLWVSSSRSLVGVE